MKKIKLFHFRSGTFRGYLVSLVGIALVALSLVWLMAVMHIVRNMQAEEIRVMESKLYTIAEDMENQMNTMRGMVIEVAMLQEFRLDHIKENKYHEIEAMERLKDYRNVSDISEGYFLKYQAHESVFSSLGTTMPLSVLLKERWRIEETEQLLTALDDVCEKSDDKIILYKDDEHVLIMYSLTQYATSSIGRNGTLVFLLTPDSFCERIERIVGKMNGDIAIYYGAFCMYGNETITTSDNVVSVNSKDDMFQVYFLNNDDALFSWKNVFSMEEVVAFAGITIFLIVIAFVFAQWNFKPIQKITEKYNSNTNDNLTPDWEGIDSLIASLLLRKENDHVLLQKQYKILKEQVIQLIVSGKYTDRLQEHLILLNIKLDFPYYGIIHCVFADAEKVVVYGESMYQKIEDLSGDDFVLYSYWENDRSMKILVAAGEEYQLEEAQELLQALFEVMEITAELKLCSKSNNLMQIHEVKENDRIVNKDEKISRIIENDKKSAFKKKNTAMQVVEYIEEHCIDYDLSLDSVAQKFQITPTYLCKIIKQEVGMSYKEYLTGLRIRAAKELLMEESISVTEVCQRVGYTNVSYFIRIFQRYTGVTPAKYRDEYEEV